MSRELSLREREQVCEKYSSGQPSTALSREFGVSCHVILRVLRQGGIQVRSKGGRVKQYDGGWTAAFVRAYSAGETIASIADRMGVGQGTVWRALKRAQIGARPHGLRKATVRPPKDPGA